MCWNKVILVKNKLIKLVLFTGEILIASNIEMRHHIFPVRDLIGQLNET